MDITITKRWASLFLVFFSFVLLVGISTRDLWNPDEPRFAQVAREMIQTENYTVPHLNGEIYTDKPPAYVWVTVAASKLFFKGETNAFTARIPSAIAAVLALLILIHLGKEMFDLKTGLIAMLILATTYRFWWQASWGQLDMLLAFFILSSLALFWTVYTSKPKYSDDKEACLWFVFYLTLAGGFLTKGPIGILIPCGIIFFFLLWQRQLSFLLKMWIPLGLLILVSTIGVWVWLAYEQAGSEYLYQHFIVHNFFRYIAPSGHIRPFYYYFINFPVDAMPWIFFLPLAIIQLRRAKEKLTPSHKFLIVWFSLVFIFFTLSDSKRSLYLLPLFPAFALFLSQYFSQLVSKAKIKRAFYVILIVATSIYTLVLLVFYPVLDKYKSARSLCNQIKPLVQNNGECASYQFFKESFLYYLGGDHVIKKIDDSNRLIQFLKSNPNNVALIQKPKMEDTFKEEITIRMTQKIGSDTYHVVTAINN